MFMCSPSQVGTLTEAKPTRQYPVLLDMGSCDLPPSVTALVFGDSSAVTKCNDQRT